jgi:hypothetical protein
MILFDIVPTGLNDIDLPAGYKHIIPMGLSVLNIRDVYPGRGRCRYTQIPPVEAKYPPRQG